jgi:protoheme IX farnesyltransferase
VALSTLKTYYDLTKPGIIYGNSISLIAGFLLASQRQVDWPLLAAALLGTALVIASGCVLNNYIDRDIDKKMDRTSKRALASGQIPPNHALIYAAVLCLLGFGLLMKFTNPLTVYTGLIGLYVYVVAYGLAKRRSPSGTLVGSIAGAAPILAGYTAASGRIDGAAILLFLSMAFWQMPHFYAIAMYRLRDYRSAGIPVLPAVKGARTTKLHIMAYIVAFTITASLLSLFHFTTYVFLAGVILLGGIWLWKGAAGFKANDDIVWARRMFRFSLLVMVAFSALLAIDPLLR